MASSRSRPCLLSPRYGKRNGDAKQCLHRRFECTSCFARSPATTAAFVPSPAFNARLSNTDSAVPYDLHEASRTKNASGIMFGRPAATHAFGYFGLLVSGSSCE